MGAFNKLNVKMHCSNCFNDYEVIIQFKYGDTWQFNYKIGDKIKWGGNDIGRPGITEVKVYGIQDSNICPICGSENIYDEYDVIIKNDIIIEVKPIAVAEDYYSEDENYKIILD